MTIYVRYKSLLKIKFEAMYLEANPKSTSCFKNNTVWNAVDSNIEQDLGMNELESFKNKFVVSILEKILFINLDKRYSEYLDVGTIRYDQLLQSITKTLYNRI